MTRSTEVVLWFPVDVYASTSMFTFPQHEANELRQSDVLLVLW